MNVTTTAHQYMNLVDDDYYTGEIQETDKLEVKQNTSSATTQINTYGTDTFDSVPEIEHYNNYSKNGVLNIDTNNNQAKSDTNLNVNNNTTQNTQKVYTDYWGGNVVYNYCENGMLINDMKDIWGNSISNSFSDDGMLIIDMRSQYIPGFSDNNVKLTTRFPQDVNNEWEFLRVCHGLRTVTGEPATLLKLPPDELRFVMLTNGPLGVRYEVEVLSVRFNIADGTQMGPQLRVIDPAKKIEDEKLIKTEMARLDAFANQTVKDFVEGKISPDDVAKSIEQIYKDLVSLSIKLGNNDGNDPIANAEILRTAQRMILSHSLRETISANHAEGEVYAKEQYGLNPGDRFVYYNAKFFHLNKELQEIAKTTTLQISKEHGFSFNPQTAYSNGSGTHKLFCFNLEWENRAKNLHISQMKNPNLEPPEGFKMFFALKLFTQEDWKNGTDIYITASDPSQPFGQNGHGFFLRVPKGASLFKKEPLWLRQTGNAILFDKSVPSFDISKNLKFMKGEDYLSSLKAFFAEYVTDFNKGALSVWSGGTKSIHDVPFDISFDDKRMFHGSELKDAIAHNCFISNFEFHMFLQW